MASRWKIRHQENNPLRKEILNELGVSDFVADVLWQRGIKRMEEARLFLYGTVKDLSAPEILEGVAPAVHMIQAAAADQKKIIVYGDYDVDGICSVFILLKTLAYLGCRAGYYIPDRLEEGYGLHEEAIRQLAQDGCQLLISVDCGIVSMAEIAYAKELGLEVIVTDHHMPGPVLPPADVIINPKLGSHKALEDLAGAGVAFKLAQGLMAGNQPQWVYQFLDLVALAIIADVVPVQGENRILLKSGLEQLRHTLWPGLKSLIEKTGLAGKVITAREVGFILAPRLNAAGRMQHADLSMALISAENEEQGAAIAEQISTLNEQRKQVEESIYQEVLQILEQETHWKNQRILIVSGDGWHPGVFGITASRLVRTTSKPVILISWNGDTGRGTARSSTGIDIYAALHHSRNFLQQYGGHKAAAGFIIKKTDYIQFVNSIRQWADHAERLGDDGEQLLYIDARLDPDQIDHQLLEDLALLAPFGEAHPEPVIVLRQVPVYTPDLVGKSREHFKCKLGEQLIEGIAFAQPGLMDLPFYRCCHDVAGHVQENFFRGQKTVQIKILDIKISAQSDFSVMNSLYQPLAYLQEMSRQLCRNKSVLLVYPTCRSLQKHRRFLEHYFPARLMLELHGKLPPQAKEAGLKAVTETGRIFLVSQVFWEQYVLSEQTCSMYVHFYQPVLSDWSAIIWQAVSREQVNQNHAIIYVNRPTTLRQLQDWWPEAIVDAGISDRQLSRKRQRQFWQQPGQLLLTDGHLFPGTDSWFGSEGALYWSDLPFSQEEFAMVMEPLGLAGKVKVLFKQEDMWFNQQFLERQCPVADDLNKVWQRLLLQRRTVLSWPRLGWQDFWSKVLKRPVKWAEVLNALRVLEDLGLCRLEKKGSIIETTLQEHNQPLNLESSLLYKESLAEKEAFDGFAQQVIKSMNW